MEDYKDNPDGFVFDGDDTTEEDLLVDEPIVDGGVDEDFPEVEELPEEGETTEEMMARFEPKRTTRPGFPLDHIVVCAECGFNGVIGFRQRMCPTCQAMLIRPEDVTGIVTQRERPRP